MGFGDLAKRMKDGSAPASTASGTTYFDESAEFSGTLHLRQSVCIDGAIEGEIDCDQTVTIGPSGRVRARIRAQSVVIEGELHGDIEARGEITLHKSARVYGDLITEGIVVEKGAKVEGRITIGAAPPTTLMADVPPRLPGLVVPEVIRSE
jgi:cytoskeletal protein CcmA (bactofilin family)